MSSVYQYEHVAIQSIDGKVAVFIDGKQVWPRRPWWKRLIGRRP